MSANASTVHVVDDDRLFRTSVARLLRRSGYQVELYESADRLLEASPGAGPACILLDVRMPGLSGPELQSCLAERDNVLPIIFLTGDGDLPTAIRAIKAGAEDFLTKPVPKKVLIDALERALARYRQTRARAERLAAMRSTVATFTPRQREVFDLMVRGKMNKQIAHDLQTAERTVKIHRHAVMQKLNVRSLAEAVSIAEQLGMLESSRAGQNG